MRKIKNKKHGVSDVLGIILLLGVTVFLFSLVTIIVLTFPIEENPPTVNIVSFVDGNDIIIEHRGGQSLSLETKVIIYIDSLREEYKIKDYLDDSAKADDFWGIGERFSYSAVDLSNKKVDLTIIDAESNSIVMGGIIQDKEG